jgi:hypothetical protein
MSDEKQWDSKLREKITGIVKKVGLLAWIKIAKFLGIPVMKDP